MTKKIGEMTRTRIDSAAVHSGYEFEGRTEWRGLTHFWGVPAGNDLAPLWVLRDRCGAKLGEMFPRRHAGDGNPDYLIRLRDGTLIDAYEIARDLLPDLFELVAPGGAAPMEVAA